jgi:hypothetical protein
LRGTRYLTYAVRGMKDVLFALLHLAVNDREVGWCGVACER